MGLAEGDYVQRRKDGRRGTITDFVNGEWIVYSPNLGALLEIWAARDDELTRLLRKDDIG